MFSLRSGLQNQYTLHTYAGCTLKQPMKATGTPLETKYVLFRCPLPSRWLADDFNSCDVAATGNAGCGIRDPSLKTFGAGWNSVGGGVYVLNWDSTGISMWVFLVSLALSLGRKWS